MLLILAYEMNYTILDSDSKHDGLEQGYFEMLKIRRFFKKTKALTSSRMEDFLKLLAPSLWVVICLDKIPPQPPLLQV